jgi:secreted Zn-dependent insulinase-like peptidase
LPLVLVVTHRRIQAVNAIAVVHLTIYNNNGNNALSTRRYSARLTHLKLEISDTKKHARLSLVGLADSVAKSISYYEDTILSILHYLYYDLSN